MDKLRIAVLISGSGTNLQAMLDRVEAGSLAVQIVVVASDRPDVLGLMRAQEAGVPAHIVNYQGHLKSDPTLSMGKVFPLDLEELDRKQRILRHPDREQRLRRLASLVLAEQELIDVLNRYQPDYICLAGFMRLLSPYFLNHFNGPSEYRVVNIHPALLPAFPGEHGYEDTFAYGCKWGGITVHFVDEGEDSGPIIAQAVYPIWAGDDVEKIRRRGLGLEYEIYPQCIKWLAAGQVVLRRGVGDRGQVVITDPGYRQILKNWVQKALSG
jgi:phosphoribosylglycinamide formyltransferase-1